MAKSSLAHWIGAMRLRTLPLALSTIITGSALAFGNCEDFWRLFGLACLTAILLQILSNFSNDLGDSISGVDNEDRAGPSRAVQSGALSRRAMKMAIGITSVLALTTGSLLLVSSFGMESFSWKIILMFVLGLASIAAAIRYTVGSNPYGYRGLGDLFVFLFFGMVGVSGVYFVMTQFIDYLVLLPSATIGLFSAAVLNLNNMRDIENDEKSGKRTLVVLIGLDNARTYHAALIILGWASVMAYFLLTYSNPLELIIFLPAPIFFRNLKLVLGESSSEKLDPELKKIALGTFLFSIVFFVAHLAV